MTKSDLTAGKAQGARTERLRAALEAKNDGNQSEMAREVGTSPQAVNKWLAGLQFPRDETLLKVAAYLGVTSSYLKFGDPEGAYVPPSKPLFVLAYVESGAETQLLHNYRSGTIAGKRQLLMASTKIKTSKKLPPLPSTPPDDD